MVNINKKFKSKKYLETVRMFSQKTSVSARDFLSLLGQLNAAADLVMLGRLPLRPLQIYLRNQWKPQNLPYSHQTGMTTEILQHLKWWLQEDLYHQGIPLRICRYLFEEIWIEKYHSSKKSTPKMLFYIC